MRHELNTLLRHTIDTPEVATIRDRKTQVIDNPVMIVQQWPFLPLLFYKGLPARLLWLKRSARNEMAPGGHTSAQRPQPMQRSASTHAILSTTIAPAGQLGSHKPQPTHFSESTMALTKEGLGRCSISLIRLSSVKRRPPSACALALRACNSSLFFIVLFLFLPLETPSDCSFDSVLPGKS
jgi:hypothetical protein